ncbi:MAG: 16S rRNA (guanine(527)-N(7))-methyltransferase RsmG [Sciscionella sp.]
MSDAPHVVNPADSARAVFGPGFDGAVRFAELLAEHGVTRGLIGPREVGRLWPRHLINSAVLAELVPSGARVVDVGSGAGFPGIPLALARPDLRVTLLEPMARRVQWLDEVVRELCLPVAVERGRAEERAVRIRLTGFDVATARAVASLGRLAGWCLPLVRPGGQLLALKGERAADELNDEWNAVRRAGGEDARLVRCGEDIVETPTTVIVIQKGSSPRDRDRARRIRKDR